MDNQEERILQMQNVQLSLQEENSVLKRDISRFQTSHKVKIPELPENSEEKGQIKQEND